MDNHKSVSEQSLLGIILNMKIANIRMKELLCRFSILIPICAISILLNEYTQPEVYEHHFKNQRSGTPQRIRSHSQCEGLWERNAFTEPI